MSSADAMPNPEAIVIDAIDSAVRIGYQVGDEPGYHEPGYSRQALCEEITRPTTFRSAENIAFVLDKYIDSVQSLALLGLASVQAVIAEYELPEVNEFELARRIGGNVCGNEAMTSLLNMDAWRSIQLGNPQSRDIRHVIQYGRATNRWYLTDYDTLRSNTGEDGLLLMTASEIMTGSISNVISKQVASRINFIDNNFA